MCSSIFADSLGEKQILPPHSRPSIPVKTTDKTKSFELYLLGRCAICSLPRHQRLFQYPHFVQGDPHHYNKCRHHKRVARQHAQYEYGGDIAD